MNWKEQCSRESFTKETGESFDCDFCKQKDEKYSKCCPEENDCPIEIKYQVWKDNKIDSIINGTKGGLNEK